jgi:hypothetical protein
MSEQLNDTEIEVLNHARRILHAHRAGFPDDYGNARLIVFAEQAEYAIFEYLNNANTWGKVPMTHEQLHLTPAPEPEPTPAEPQSLRAPEPTHFDPLFPKAAHSNPKLRP